MRLAMKGAAWIFAMLLFFVFTDLAIASLSLGRISLNGVWERQDTTDFSLGGLGEDRWRVAQVPGVHSRPAGHFTAYRKKFFFPAESKGRRVLLHVGGVAYACRIYLNGEAAGEQGPTLEPFSLELTNIMPGENELIVVVQDWTAGIEGQLSHFRFSPGRIEQAPVHEFSPGSPDDPAIQQRIISPVGSSSVFGIFDDVWIEVVKDIRLDEVTVDSRVLKGIIRIRCRVENLGTVTWKGDFRISINSLESGPGKAGLVALRTGQISIPSGGVRRFTADLDARGLDPWEHDRPILYRLVIEADGGFRVSFPFGYRQIAQRRHELFLNGKKIHLFTASIGPGLTREALAARIRQLKSLNINAVRFHGSIFPEWVYDLTDRLGILVIGESALYGSGVTQFNYESEQFFKNAAAHWRGLVRKFRNHPSVIVYSIENECVEYSRGKRAEAKFAELGRKVKKWDPTRPVLFNGGDDPGGAADIISLHYPHELPFWNQYPRDAWWLRKAFEKSGVAIDSFWYRKPHHKWIWKKNKPLDIGEIGYPTGGEPHSEAVLLGDIAYGIPVRTAQDMAQAEIWKHSVDAARALDVAMINPWNPPAGERANAALREAYRPVRIIPEPENPVRFYSGARTLWKGALVNDTRESQKLVLSYRLEGNDNRGFEVDQKWTAGKQVHILRPGEIRAVRFPLGMPVVQRIQPCKISISLSDPVRNGPKLYGLERIIKVYPPLDVSSGRKFTPVLVYDPEGRTEGVLKKLGIRQKPVSTIPEEGAPYTLVIGEGALRRLDAENLTVLQQRLQSGQQTTIILAQQNYPQGFPFGLTLNRRHGTSRGFIAAPGHPLFGDLSEADVQLWARDLSISKRDFNLPTGGGYRALVVGGGTGGLVYTPLIEKPGTAGTTLFCQFSIGEKIAREPAAASLFLNMIRYGEDFRNSVRPQRMGVIVPDELRAALHQWGNEVGSVLPGAAGIKMIRGAELARDPQVLPGCIEEVKKGGGLWLYALDPGTAKKLEALLAGVEIIPLDKTKLPAKILRDFRTSSGQWTDGLLNQFLYWTEPYTEPADVFSPLTAHSQNAFAFRKADRGGDSVPQWKGICDPALIAAARIGEGWLIIDTLDWPLLIGRRSHSAGIIPESENQVRAVRLLTGLLTNLGGMVEFSPVLQIEAEDMSKRTPGQPVSRNRNHHYWEIFKNNYLAEEFDFRKGPVRIEVKAKSRAPLGISPEMHVVLNGKVLGTANVREPDWHNYRFETFLKGGKNRLEIRLVNNPEDAYNHRYLGLDRIRITPLH